MTKEQARAELRAWVVATSGGKISPEELRDDTPLLEQRIISSLHVAELVLFVESLRGGPIDLTRIDGKALRDINSMCETFLGDLEAA
jgi:acyl carrier protein